MHLLSCHSPFHSLMSPLLLRWISLLVTIVFTPLLCLYSECVQRRRKWNICWTLIFVKSRQEKWQTKKAVSDAENFWCSCATALSPTVSQFHNLNNTREVSFCFSFMLKSKSSVGLQQRKKVHPREWHYLLQCNTQYNGAGCHLSAKSPHYNPAPALTRTSALS